MGLRYRHAMNLAYAAVAGCIALGACVDGPTSTSPVASALEPSHALVPLDRFGIGQGGRANACRAPEYRQFDCWVGNWDIQTPTGAAAVSIISSVLGQRARAGHVVNRHRRFAERQTQNALALTRAQKTQKTTKQEERPRDAGASRGRSPFHAVSAAF